MKNEAKEMLKQVDKIATPKETWTPLYSVKDLKVGYITEFKCQNDLIALRTFSDDVKNEKSPLSKHPEDYELWCIGKMCLETGVIISDIRYLGRALDYVSGEN